MIGVTALVVGAGVTVGAETTRRFTVVSQAPAAGHPAPPPMVEPASARPATVWLSHAEVVAALKAGGIAVKDSAINALDLDYAHLTAQNATGAAHMALVGFDVYPTHIDPDPHMPSSASGSGSTVNVTVTPTKARTAIAIAFQFQYPGGKLWPGTISPVPIEISDSSKVLAVGSATPTSLGNGIYEWDFAYVAKTKPLQFTMHALAPFLACHVEIVDID
jgi:hypothetical protein